MKENPTKTVCFFNSNKAWGGGEKWHFTAAKELTRRGYTTFLCTNRNSELTKKAIQERVDVYQWIVGNLSFLNPLKIFVLAAFFKAKKVDVVILNLPSDLKFAGLAAKLAGVRKIIYRRGMPHPLRNTWLNRFLFQKILTDVIVNSKETSETLKQQNQEWFPSQKLIQINNSIDTVKDFDRTNKLYKKTGNEIVIGNLGRLTDQKGQIYLIELAQLIKESGINFKILIAGSGELKKQFHELIEKSNLKNSIELVGHINDIASFMNSIDVFIFPSLFEGSSNTLLEALYYEKPVICFDIEPNKEIITDKETGFIVKKGDVSELFAKFLELKDSKELQLKFITNGKKLLNETYNLQSKMDQLVSML